MRYFGKNRNQQLAMPRYRQAIDDNDPLTGVANLFDLGLVFIVGLIITLFSAYQLQDLFSKKSNFTIMKTDESGRLEIISKKGKKSRQ